MSLSVMERAAFRFLDAYEEEGRAWNVYSGAFKFIATDDIRWFAHPRECPKNGIVTQVRFHDRGQALRFIKLECIKAGLRHILYFWRKNPK